MHHYCSLADKRYLGKFLSLYESLSKHSSEDFHVHFLAMDSESAWLLQELNLSRVTVYGLNHFEAAMHMQQVKESRNTVEYFWTCASSFMEFLVLHFHLEELTYLDSDLFFFSDPKTVFEELGEKSIAIVPHRFSPPNKYLERNGLFNVGWLTVVGEIGRECLVRWASQTRAWCYHRNDQGKFGDQGYLDEWPKLYGNDCCVIENIGVGVAPWNLQQYKVREGPLVNGVPVVFYHFHELQQNDKGNITRLTNYGLRDNDKEFIYLPYTMQLMDSQKRIDRAQETINVRRSVIAGEADRA